MELFKQPAQRALQIITLIFLSAVSPALAQQLPIVRATATTVDIRDGNVFQKGVWNLSPEVKFDTYTVLAPPAAKKVVFYTDIDSISFLVTPGKVYDFIVLLNGKDSCFTRISAPDAARTAEVRHSPADLIPAAKLKNDFRLLQETLQKIHPGLYRYKSKAEVERIFSSNSVLLDHPMDQFDFGKIVMTVVSAIEDGHTSTDMPRLLVSYYQDHDKLFPVPLYLRENHAYVICDGVNGLPPASEVLAINGHPFSAIRQAMYALLPGDGRITTKKRHVINEGAFPILYRLIYGASDAFLVQYKTSQGKMARATISALPAKDFPCEPRLETASRRDLEFSLLQNGIALLKIRSFEMNRVGGKDNFHAFLDSNFSKIRSMKITRLIVDVRDNGGGEDDLGAWLYSYLTDKPFHYYQSLQRVDGIAINKDHPNLQLQQPSPLNFKGNCYFLINGRSFSTTSEFCSIAKSNNRGPFIGEETGGTYYGNTSGEQLKLSLPNSGITVIIPEIKYTLAVHQVRFKDRGVIPDHTLIPAIQDVLAGKDVQLNFAIKLANSTTKK